MADETQVKTDESASELHFWRVMTYRCTGCQRTLRMYLEDGCEGPTGGREVRTAFPAGSPGFLAGQTALLRFTPGGRLIQPVPFSISCTCPVRGAYMAHIHWSRDEEIDCTVPANVEPQFPHFRYDEREDPSACGRPVGHR